MFSKVSVAALCAAASLNGATAAAHHRHQHPKKALVYETDVVVVTQYATATVTVGAQPPQIQTTNPAPVAVTPTTLATAVKPAPAADTSAPVPAAVKVPSQAPAPVEVPEVPSVPVVPSVAPAASSAAPTAPVSTESAPSSSKGGKRGLAYNDPNIVKTLLAQTDAIHWVYNWGNEAWGLDVDVPYYPCMWGEKFAADWPASAQAAVDKGTEYIFSFNEPDNAGQANMAPAYAAAKHQEWLNPYAGGPKVGAPSISSSQEANQGLDWLDQFFDACDGKCKVDFCNAHWYGPGGESGAEEFLNHLKDVRDSKGCKGKPLFVTEFMPMGSASDNAAFMKKAIQALESSEFDFVEKYSYFMAAVGDSYLMSSDSELNPLGKIYANLA